MHYKRLAALSVLLLVCIGIGLDSLPLYAQDNLLRDPGFENTSVWRTVVFDEGSGSRFSVAPDWEGWYTTSPRTQSWMNQVPNGYPHSETGAGFTRSGNRAQEISRGGATFTAAVYQTVTVPENANVTGSAWVRMNLNLNADPDARARVGIDPNGGSNPFASEIVWSSWVRDSVNNFQQMTVNATANGTRVTLFLYATQSFPSDPNGVYWDDASLTVGGPGGAAPGQPAPGQPAAPVNTPVPTPPPSAPSVTPQCSVGEVPCVHTVREGDTLAAIAVGYGVPMSRIVELNNMTSTRFLQIGQRLTIRAASEEASEGTTGTQSGAPAQPAAVTVDEDSEEEPAEEEPTPTVTPTPTPAPTNTPAPPAPVAVADADLELDLSTLAAAVCVQMFEDVNMNRIQDQGEQPLEGGMITLRHQGTDLDTFATDGTPEMFCFTDLEPGEYTAVALPPGGYGLTTPDQLRLRLQSGTSLNVAFGAAEGVEAVAPPPADAVADPDEQVVTDVVLEDDATGRILQNIGLIVFGLAALTLVGGLGLTLLLRRR
jgi:LysM repeat protein